MDIDTAKLADDNAELTVSEQNGLQFADEQASNAYIVRNIIVAAFIFEHAGP